ncbi:MAG: hypothetical protein M3326_14080, partial [Actinomycetota bacterium]|nr:hypothetical protein [Actinomycetota bacterium]
MAPAAGLVFVVLAAAAVTAFGITRNVVHDHEHRLLEERAGEVRAFLQNSLNTSSSNLAVLAVLAAGPDRAAFEQGARVLARTPASTVAAVSEDAGGLTVTSAVGG